MLKIIKEAADDSKVDTSLENNEEENENNLENNFEKNPDEESEIVITSDEFNQKVNSIISRLKSYLQNNNKTLKDIKGIYQASIVWAFFVKKKTRFTDLDPSEL